MVRERPNIALEAGAVLRDRVQGLERMPGVFLGLLGSSCFHLLIVGKISSLSSQIIFCPPLRRPVLSHCLQTASRMNPLQCKIFPRVPQLAPFAVLCQTLIFSVNFVQCL